MREPDRAVADRRKASPLLRTKPKHRRALQRLSGPQNRRGEGRLVRRIGIVLRLQAEAVAELVGAATLAREFPVEKVAAIELQAWLRREHLHRAARRRLMHGGGESEAASLVVQHPVVVVTAAELHLFVCRVHAFADGVRGGEVERRSLHRPQLARAIGSFAYFKFNICYKKNVILHIFAYSKSVDILYRSLYIYCALFN